MCICIELLFLLPFKMRVSSSIYLLVYFGPIVKSMTRVFAKWIKNLLEAIIILSFCSRTIFLALLHHPTMGFWGPPSHSKYSFEFLLLLVSCPPKHSFGLRFLYIFLFPPPQQLFSFIWFSWPLAPPRKLIFNKHIHGSYFSLISTPT